MHGDLPHVKKKRYIKILRKQARLLQKKVKQQGLMLTATEQNIIDKEKSKDLLRRNKTKPFLPAFQTYFLESSLNFSESYGAKKLRDHHALGVELHLYHSYKW